MNIKIKYNLVFIVAQLFYVWYFIGEKRENVVIFAVVFFFWLEVNKMIVFR